MSVECVFPIVPLPCALIGAPQLDVFHSPRAEAFHPWMYRRKLNLNAKLDSTF
jgi:hypothetical protein